MQGLPLALVLTSRLCDNGPVDLPRLANQYRGKPALDILKLEGEAEEESGYTVIGGDEIEVLAEESPEVSEEAGDEEG